VGFGGHARSREKAAALNAPQVRRSLMDMKRIFAIALSAAALAACQSTSMGPGGRLPSPPPQAPPASIFRAQDFAWSTAPGRAQVQGQLAYKVGSARYTCQGTDVVLTPETPWSRRRMTILYGSPTSAAVPVATVRARTPSAPSGDYASFVRHATCDASSRFSFAGLPDGAWFVITVAKPMAGQGEPVAVMRRIETRGGRSSVTLN